MSSESDETPVENSRRAEARKILVATVDSSPLKTRRSSSLIAVLAASVFVVGALTGGAVAYARPAVANWWDDATARDAVLHAASGGALVGKSQLQRSKGVAIADLGSPPNGADAIAIAIPCQNVGQVLLALEGGKEARSVFRCAHSGSLAERFPVDPTGSYRLTVTAPKSHSIIVTWAWAQTSRSGALFKLQQQLNQLEQTYNQQLKNYCRAAELASSSCPSPTPSGRP